MIEQDDDDVPDGQFTSSDKEWFANKDRAMARAAKSAAAREAAAGGPIGGPTAAQIQAQRAAQAAAQKHAASMRPGQLGGRVDPLDIDFDHLMSIPDKDPEPIFQNSTPASAPVNAPAPSGPAGHIVFWTAGLPGDGKTEYHAESWDALKDKLKTCSGDYVATRHDFVSSPSNLIKFFVTHEPIEPITSEGFDVIIANGKVFKAE